jgi:hypothetical protein
MLDNRFGDFETDPPRSHDLSEAGDLDFLERGADVEGELLFRGQSGHDRLPCGRPGCLAAEMKC